MNFLLALVATISLVFLPEQVYTVSPVELVCGVLDIAVLPEIEPSKIDFLLWTNENPDNYYKIIPFNKTSLDASNFDGNRNTICMIHGFTDNGTKPWIIEAKDEFLASQGANVISLNYSAYVTSRTAEPLDYAIAVCNAYRVAKYAAEVFNWISKNSALTGSRLHLIGHSLGAHVAGIMGHYMILLPIGKIIRISGLDPAGILFSNEDGRLGRGQADFIDVINTNGCPNAVTCLGLGESIGDANFYPNGGELQPGCPSTNASCSHQRVTALYVESIRPKDKTFKSWPCENYQKFLDGGCPTCEPSGCQYMGHHVLTNLTGDFSLTTNAVPLYAKGNVQN